MMGVNLYLEHTTYRYSWYFVSQTVEPPVLDGLPQITRMFGQEVMHLRAPLGHAITPRSTAGWMDKNSIYCSHMLQNIYYK